MKIDINVPDGKKNNWKVQTFSVTEKESKFFNIRAAFEGGNRRILPGTYKRLTMNDQVIMSNTPAEIRDHVDFINKARQGGDILINGLGLGMVLKAILESPHVLSVTVVEKSKDVISLVAEHYISDKRITIIHADALSFVPPNGQRYSAVWHDIWDDICGDNLPEMTKLHHKYRQLTDWQRSWCEKTCRKLQS